MKKYLEAEINVIRKINVKTNFLKKNYLTNCFCLIKFENSISTWEING